MTAPSIRAIIPRKLLVDPKRIIRAVENALTGTALAVKVDFDTTTQTWRKRPKFTIKRMKLKRIISTGDDVYRYVARGTRPHIIAPREGGPGILAFKRGGRPKTTPRYIGSNKGAPGTQQVFALRVHHPGTKAREFEPTIAEKWRKEMPVQIQRAIDAEVTA